MDQTKQNLVPINKLEFITGVNAAVGNENALIIITVADVFYRFSLSPEHFKRITILFRDILGKYEAAHGLLPDWTPPTLDSKTPSVMGFGTKVSDSATSTSASQN